MPRDPEVLLFIGIYNSVLAVNARDGTERWRTKLGGTSLVAVHWDGDHLFAATKGEVFRLDPRTGAVIWHNKLRGLGTGFVTLTSSRARSEGAAQVTTSAALRTRAVAGGAGA